MLNVLRCVWEENWGFNWQNVKASNLKTRADKEIDILKSNLRTKLKGHYHSKCLKLTKSTLIRAGFSFAKFSI